MNTLSKVCKQVVESSINADYVTECGGSLQKVYMSEYGLWNGCSSKACESYLQGLPSVCTVPFYNGDILDLLAKHGISRKTDTGQADLIDDYWKECGVQFYKIVKGQ